MRPRIRRILEWVADTADAALGEPQAEPTWMEIPATDEDGDPCWLTMAHEPTDDELQWAVHPCLTMRSAYAIYAVTKGREVAEHNGYELGWV